MAKDIVTYSHPLFGELRTMVMPDGQIVFVGKDVATALKYANPTKACNMHVEKEDKLMSKMDTSFGAKETLFINESGLYCLVFGSKMPKAREFKHWVTAEVLPQIRQTGGYIAMAADDDENTIMAKALLVAQRTIERKDALIGRLQPKADYVDEVLDSVSCMTVTQIAKGMGMTGAQLNRLLCQKGIQYKQSGQYLLYAVYARMGLAQNRTYEYHNSKGELCTSSQLVWTEKGKEFIIRLLN